MTDLKIADLINCKKCGKKDVPLKITMMEFIFSPFTNWKCKDLHG